MSIPSNVRTALQTGVAIPAHPLALNASLKLDERRQRALARYYIAAGSGGLAVGVHTTQFEIHNPEVGLLKPVLQLAKEEMDRADASRSTPLVRISGVCGKTEQAVQEAQLAADLGYHAGLLSLVAVADKTEDQMIAHCKAVSQALPLVGFYLQTAAHGPILPYSFWRKFADIKNVAAIKIAPFHRYRTIDVVRAIAESGREDIALYTGNDDTIVTDLLTPFTFHVDGKPVTRRIVGGLLGHWGVWTQKSVALLNEIKAVRLKPSLDANWLTRGAAVTDMNAALFDAANRYAGCIPGILEVLRRQRLTPSCCCLNPHEFLSPGQADELTRVCRAYPELTDDDFVAQHIEEWLS
jgi:dihydrodipicolinate synthase/N-acetylneuraminate lyase